MSVFNIFNINFLLLLLLLNIITSKDKNVKKNSNNKNKFTNLTVKSDNPSITFITSKKTYKFNLKNDNLKLLLNDYVFFNLNKNNTLDMYNSILYAQNLNVENIFINGDKLYAPYFNLNISNYSIDKITQCFDYKILGGLCKFKDDFKIKINLKELPKHASIKIEFNIVYFGPWFGETFYIKLNNESIIYTTTNDSRNTKQTYTQLDCIDYKNPNFNHNNRLEFDHIDDSLELLFDTNISRDNCEASFGITNLQIYLK